MDPRTTEVSQTFERFKAALIRKDFGTCTNLLSQLKVSLNLSMKIEIGCSCLCIFFWVCLYLFVFVMRNCGWNKLNWIVNPSKSVDYTVFRF